MIRDKATLKKDGWHYLLDGKEVTQEEFEKRYPPPEGSGGGGRGNRPWAKPIHSEALAVHPNQIPEVMERNAARGLHVNYDSEGRPILQDRDQRRRLCEIEGVFDKDGGYSDTQHGSTVHSQIKGETEIQKDLRAALPSIPRDEFIRLYKEEEARQGKRYDG